MAHKVKLDSVDRQILHDLQDNGRITNVDLAKSAGISAPPCLRRVRALEKAGIIKGYQADIDADALGFSVQVFASVGLTSQAEADLQNFETLVSTWPQVRECHMLMGETDFLLKIVAHDWDDFQKFLTGHLTPAKNVSHVKTALAIRSSKQLPGVPIDRLDRQILTAQWASLPIIFANWGHFLFRNIKEIDRYNLVGALPTRGLHFN